MTLSLFLGAETVWAQEICSDLFKGSCDQEILDDGTGLVAIQTQEHEESVKGGELLIGKKDEIHKFFQQNKKLVRAQALAKLNLRCKVNNPIVNADSEECDSEIESKLVDLVSSRFKTGTSGRYQVRELSFMEDSGYLALMNKLSFGNKINVNVAEQEKKVERLFGQVKKALLDKLQKSNLETDKKQAIMDRLQRVQNKGSDCFSEVDDVSYSFLPKAFYNPGTNDFYLCRNLLNSVNSEFALTTVIAHEISHSIDPIVLRIDDPQKFGSCNTEDIEKAEAESQYANLTQCLRSSESVHATSKYVLEAKAVGRSSPYPAVLCDQNDQIGETTADWFASEVLVDVVKQNYPKLSSKQWQNGFRNTFRAKCDQQHLDEHAVEFEPHAKLQDRYNSILLANKSVREKMGCTKAYNKVQCSLDRLNTSQGTASGSTNVGSGLNSKSSAAGQR